ncbi:MAG: hypothetical protein ACKO2G_00210 [Verrucomicrobiales bacterium]
MENDKSVREFGVQPLDAIMAEAGLENHALVEASGEFLTHKEVAKGRKGRRLTPNLMGKITRALNRVLPREPAWQPKDLFTYAAKNRAVEAGKSED